MSKSTIGLRKAGIASIATTALVMGAGFAGAGTASAVPGFTFDREAGADRYGTAADIATSFDATEDVSSVILASGQAGRFPDALSGNYLAGELNAPILLTRLNDMPASTRTALESLGDVDIKVVGGDGVISDAQLDALRADGYDVQRFGGPVRYDTNAEVIEAGGTTTDTLGIIASGENFPDALAAGPVAFSEGYALGLTKMNDVPNQVIAALQDAGVDRAVIVGGAGVVSQAVVDELEAKGIDVIDRLWGPNRDDTAAEVARWAVEDLGFSETQVSVASGYGDGGGADALAGGPLSGAMGWPLLITRNIDVPGSGTLGFLSEYCPTLTDGVIYGGNGAVSAGAEAEMEEAASNCGAPSNQDFTVTPAEAATNTVSTDTGDNANRGLRQYTVTGLDNATAYDVALFDAADVTVGANGTVTFADDDSNNQADWTANADATTGAVIEVVNGSSNVPEDNHIQVNPVNGTISFSVDSETADSVVPVIFLDAGATGSNALAVDNDGLPTEEFGVGGQKTWVPEEAPSGAVAADDEIESVDKASDTIVAVGGVYNYDTNDTFYITGNADDVRDPEEQVTYAEFEAQLSVGDSISAGTVYQRNPDFTSSFLLDDDAPGDTDVTVDTVTEDSVELTITPPAGFDSDDTVTLSRAASTDDGGTPANCTDDTFGTAAAVATLTAADDEDTAGGAPGIQYTDTVPAADCYEYSATSMIDGEESEAGATDVTPAPTTTDTTPPDMTDATAADINNGVGSTNQVIVTFDEAVTAVDAALLTVHPALQPGLEIDVTNAAQRNTSGTTWTLTLSQALDDASIDITYNIDTEAGAYEDAEGNETAAKAADTTFAY